MAFFPRSTHHGSHPPQFESLDDVAGTPVSPVVPPTGNPGFLEELGDKQLVKEDEAAVDRADPSISAAAGAVSGFTEDTKGGYTTASPSASRARDTLQHATETDTRTSDGYAAHALGSVAAGKGLRARFIRGPRAGMQERNLFGRRIVGEHEVHVTVTPREKIDDVQAARRQEAVRRIVYRDDETLADSMANPVAPAFTPDRTYRHRSWAAEEDAFNVRQLRDMIETRARANNLPPHIIAAQLEHTGVREVEGELIADYFGVDPAAWARQKNGGPFVVHPQVLHHVNMMLKINRHDLDALVGDDGNGHAVVHSATLPRHPSLDDPFHRITDGPLIRARAFRTEVARGKIEAAHEAPLVLDNKAFKFAAGYFGGDPKGSKNGVPLPDGFVGKATAVEVEDLRQMYINKDGLDRPEARVQAEKMHDLLIDAGVLTKKGSRHEVNSKLSKQDILNMGDARDIIQHMPAPEQAFIDQAVDYLDYVLPSGSLFNRGDFVKDLGVTAAVEDKLVSILEKLKLLDLPDKSGSREVYIPSGGTGDFKDLLAVLSR